METFTAIFTQLGVDSSLVQQLLIILVVFIIAQFVFLGKLQQVLETREEKTVKLENSATDTIEKVQKMQNEYRQKIDEANQVANRNAADKKQKLIQKYTDIYKQTEKEVGAYVDQTKNDFSKEIEENKQKYFSEADQLAGSLVQKILQ
jgi:F0F1-type ATP synthase membrane subunit b/b'